MRAVVLHEPYRASVDQIATPQPTPGEVLVRVLRVGMCATDLELYTGTHPYFADGTTTFPLTPGHEWVGEIVEAGSAADEPRVGQYVTGNTFLGCGECEHCRRGDANMCATRREVGVRGNAPGAMAEYLVMPAASVYRLPAAMPHSIGALVEPASCSLRGIDRAQVTGYDDVLVWGPGTLGLLAAYFARQRGAAVSVTARTAAEHELIADLGFSPVPAGRVAAGAYSVVVEATGADAVISRLLEPAANGARIVLIGLPVSEVGLPVAEIVTKDVAVHGILGGATYYEMAIDELNSPAAGDLQRLVARSIRLDDVPAAFADGFARGATAAPKIQVVINDRLSAPATGLVGDGQQHGN